MAELDTTNALVTLAEAREYCGIAADDDTYDDRLTDLINAISWRFNKYTRRKLKAQALTEYYDGDGGRILYLNSFPINSVTSLHVDTDRQYGAATARTDYVTYSDVGKLALTESVFNSGHQSVKIVYNAGFETIPYELAEAALKQIKSAFRKWERNLEEATAEQTETGSITFIDRDEFLPSVKAVLDHYRRPGHGYIYS